MSLFVCISVINMYGTVCVVKNLRLVWKLSEKCPAFFYGQGAVRTRVSASTQISLTAAGPGDLCSAKRDSNFKRTATGDSYFGQSNSFCYSLLAFLHSV
jgi:hypothetical protein